jgi:predicted transposase YbfD/YdcC
MSPAVIVQKAHGRRTISAIKVLTAPAWITLTAAAQVAQVRRTTTRSGKKTVEVVYVITPPTTLGTWVQGHQGIENRTHRVRDVTYDEDRSQVRTGNGPHVMATLRNTAISLLRLDGATNIPVSPRHHASQTQRPINLLLTS